MQTSELVTISGGGNDANFLNILNYCIFQWATIWFWTCDWALSNGKGLVEEQAFTDKVKALLVAVKPKMDASQYSRVYWVGYERFFDASTKECDSVTWAFTRNYGFRQYLTQDRRLVCFYFQIQHLCN